MLLGETVAVYCENRTEHTDTYKLSQYRIRDSSHHRYRAQPVYAVWRNRRCLLRTIRNTQIHINSMRTSPETHHVSVTESNRLMLSGETVAFTVRTVRNIQIHINSVRTSPETHHISATEPRRLMLCWGTVDVYCENRTEHTDTYKLSSYLTGNTSRLHYRAQPVNAVWGNSRFYCENRTEHTDTYKLSSSLT
jgi:hypothetical protein